MHAVSTLVQVPSFRVVIWMVTLPRCKAHMPRFSYLRLPASQPFCAACRCRQRWVYHCAVSQAQSIPSDISAIGIPTSSSMIIDLVMRQNQPQSEIAVHTSTELSASGTVARGVPTWPASRRRDAHSEVGAVVVPVGVSIGLLSRCPLRRVYQTLSNLQKSLFD